MFRLKQWNEALGLELDKNYYTHVCSQHFEEKDLDPRYLFALEHAPEQAGRRRLDKNAIPHLHIPEGEFYCYTFTHIHTLKYIHIYYIKLSKPFYICFSFQLHQKGCRLTLLQDKRLCSFTKK